MSQDNKDVEIDNQEIVTIIERILQAEQDKLHLKNPRGIRDDIEDIIREEVK